jgi:predicted small integral membrane protein
VARLVRLGKTALVGTVALLFLLFAFGNVTDPGTNWAFVKHVLTMDTIFPGSTLGWRAITDPTLQAVAYGTIIAYELATGLVLAVATVRLAAASRDAARFQAAKPLAALGLMMGLVLYGLGFTVVGGEWFAMWQSHQWNGLDSDNRFVTLTGIVLIVLMQGEGGGAVPPP